MRFFFLTKEDDDSSNEVNVNNSVMAQDQVIVSRVPNSTLGQALTAYIPNTSPNTVQQQRIEKYNLISI